MKADVASLLFEAHDQLALAQAYLERSELETSDSAVAGIIRVLGRVRTDLVAIEEALPDEAKRQVVGWEKRVERTSPFLQGEEE